MHLALVVTASSAVAGAGVEAEDLKKLVKSRLPGGFAAQNIIGPARRKCAIARVVLREGFGKIIINYRDAKEPRSVRETIPLYPSAVSNNRILLAEKDAVNEEGEEEKENDA